MLKCGLYGSGLPSCQGGKVRAEDAVIVPFAHFAGVSHYNIAGSHVPDSTADLHSLGPVF